jgi:hypothetical protein
MAARIRRLQLTDEWRAKIQTSMLINRLSDHALGNCELTSTQIKAIEILIRKTLPDLQSIESVVDMQADLSVRKVVINGIEPEHAPSVPASIPTETL